MLREAAHQAYGLALYPIGAYRNTCPPFGPRPGLLRWPGLTVPYRLRLGTGALVLV